MIELNLPAVPFCEPSEVKFGLLVPSSKAIVTVGEVAPGARVCEIHTGPYAHVFHSKGRDPESKPVVAELEKIARAGEAIRGLGMRFNAGHALNYFNVQPIAALPGVRELHIGHAIVARSVFVGMREAVREMKALMQGARYEVRGAR